MTTCPFCVLSPSRIADENEHCIAIRDAFPVSSGHTLVIPKRHVASFFELSEAEARSVLELLQRARQDLAAAQGADGFNIGINDGSAAGQTVPHVHIHLIPRYFGDVVDPRGGVRWIFPEKAKYWSDR